jgi:hypothetical protein
VGCNFPFLFLCCFCVLYFITQYCTTCYCCCTNTGAAPKHNATICDPKLRTMNIDAACGSTEDVTYYAPWRYPGTVRVLHPEFCCVRVRVIGCCCTVRFFPAAIYTRGVQLSFTPLLRLKRCHACDQCHSSRVSFALTGWHCNFRQNTEGAAPVIDSCGVAGGVYQWQGTVLGHT